MNPDDLHKCACDGCKKQIARRLLMCLPHWRMVPAALQRGVWTTFREWNRTGASANRRAYIEAVHRAIAAVREKEIKRAVRDQSRGDNLTLQ